MKFLAVAAAASTVAAQKSYGQKNIRGYNNWGANGLLHTLNEGDLCRSGGVETGRKVDNSKHCPKALGLQCSPQTGVMGIGGEVNYYCCKDSKNCGPAKAEQKVQVEWCDESPAQMCRALCPTMHCTTDDQCAMRIGSCCNYECQTPTPDANGEDDEGCEGINVSSQDEMKYKEEFDLLDTDNDDSVSTEETTSQIQQRWQQRYAHYCNGNDADKSKYGKWNEWGKDKDNSNSDWKKTWDKTKTNVQNGVDSVKNGLKNGVSGFADKFKDFTSGSKTKGRKLQQKSSFADRVRNFFGGKAGAGGKNKDEDCTQELNDKAATAASQVFKQLDSDGDNKISFCEYAQARVNMKTMNDDIITVSGNRMLAEA